VSRAIAMGDWTAVKAAPGVGPKIAQRVVNELKDKAPTVMAMGAPATPVPMAPTTDPLIEPITASAPAGAAQAEALSALGNLGYAPSEAARAVAEAASDDPEADTAALIRTALRRLAPAG
ncbi:MAG: Holliday junction branch migration protein RuvA, partial [Pseudomonadota bacterium]